MRELAPLAAARIGALKIVAKWGWLLETVDLENKIGIANKHVHSNTRARARPSRPTEPEFDPQRLRDP